jgi:hypothetical protein
LFTSLVYYISYPFVHFCCFLDKFLTSNFQLTNTFFICISLEFPLFAVCFSDNFFISCLSHLSLYTDGFRDSYFPTFIRNFLLILLEWEQRWLHSSPSSESLPFAHLQFPLWRGGSCPPCSSNLGWHRDLLQHVKNAVEGTMIQVWSLKWPETDR